MSHGKDDKPTPAADSVAEETAMERKLLALKKAVKDLFTPENPHHIGVDHYDPQNRNFILRMCTDIYGSMFRDIKTKFDGLSPDGIENQIPTIHKLGYGQSFLEVIDFKQAEEEVIKLPQVAKNYSKQIKTR